MSVDHNKVFASKSEPMKNISESIAQLIGWDGEGDHCRTCNKPVTGFRDKLSEDEYYISGMCQRCQDDIFGA